MFYHLNVAQTIKGRPRLETCLWERPNQPAVIRPAGIKRVKNGYSSGRWPAMDAHGPLHASGYLRPQGLRLWMCKMGTILCGHAGETKVLESASKYNTSYQHQVKVTFCFLVPEIWLLFSHLFSCIFKRRKCGLSQKSPSLLLREWFIKNLGLSLLLFQGKQTLGNDLGTQSGLVQWLR